MIDTKTDVRQIQLRIFDVFKEVIKVCEENDIEYFIVAGTLLGAIRHQGFIPWDDDLDIGMTRSNYNRFMEIAQNKLPKNMFLQNFHSEGKTPFYFAKVRMNDTEFVENYCRNLDIHHGVYIDIFPYDNIPDIEFKQKIHLLKVEFWSNLFIAKSLKGSSVPQETFAGKIKVAVRSVFHYLLKPFPKNILFDKLDKVTQSYNNENTLRQSYVKEPEMSLHSADIENLIYLDFEGEIVKSPSNPRQALTSLYGDYMALPPQEDRVGHRPYKVVL